MLERTRELYAELAAALGLAALPPDANGGVQLDVGADTTVILYGENDAALLVVVPIMQLPSDVSPGVTLWLLRRNFYDSGIAPFALACDAAGTLVLWGRVPIDGLTGARLAGLLDAVGAEARTVRNEVGEG